MNTKYSLAALSDDALDRGIQTCAARKHTTDAELLAFIAEYDSRRRYLALGFDSMAAFCVQALHLSEDSTYKRLQVVRVAREFPAIFPALAEGRLHLTAVNLLAPHLNAETADELIAAATHKSKTEVRELLAERYPREQASRMSLLSVANEQGPRAAESGDPPSAALEEVEGHLPQLAPAQVEGEQTKLAPAQVEEVDCWARITPLSGDRYSVSLTIDRATHELWRHNQSLLSHLVPSGNLAEVLRRALAESAQLLEKRKFRASGKARRPGCRKPTGRYIPKQVRDAVWQRDGGCCTFVGKDGHRCGSRTRLELDHVVPVARGGVSTVDNLRLRCRVHNQYEADRMLGADFMRHKREQAREVAEARETQSVLLRKPPSGSECEGPGGEGPSAGDHAAPANEPAVVAPGAMSSARSDRQAVALATVGLTPRKDATAKRDWIAEARARASAAGVFTRREPDVASALRHLGLRADRAQELAKVCDTIPEAPFEERLRVALSFHGATVATPVRVEVDAPACRATQ